eukprot:1149672-Pelagomonas_calceolata.AAC.3
MNTQQGISAPRGNFLVLATVKTTDQEIHPFRWTRKLPLGLGICYLNFPSSLVETRSVRLFIGLTLLSKGYKGVGRQLETQADLLLMKHSQPASKIETNMPSKLSLLAGHIGYEAI